LIEDEVTRVSTGVDKLDAALEGGVPKGSWVAVTGEPGTGKSILCIHYAWAGLKAGDPVIYVTTEAEFRDVLRQARQFRMYLDDYEIYYLGGRPSLRRPQLVVIDIFSLLKTARQLSGDLEEVEKGRKYAALEIDVLIAAIREAYRVLGLVGEGRRTPSRHVRLVIDSLSAFWADRPAMARRFSYQLKIATHRENVTAFLVSQYAMTTKSVDASTPIIVMEGSSLRVLAVSTFVDRFFDKGEEGFKPLGRSGLMTLTLNPESRIFEWGEITAVARHRGSGSSLVVKASGNRLIGVSQDHSLIALRGDEFVPVKASELRIGDLLPALPPKGLGRGAVPVMELVRVEDIRKEPGSKYVYDLSVRGNENFVAGRGWLVAHNSTFGFGLEHIADGVIHLWMSNPEEVKEVRRFLIIKKMRMTNHYEGAFRVYIVPGKGLELRPLTSPQG